MADRSRCEASRAFAMRVSRALGTKILLSLLSVGLTAVTGCYERNLAPRVEYAESDVEILRNEIENMDWD